FISFTKSKLFTPLLINKEFIKNNSVFNNLITKYEILFDIFLKCDEKLVLEILSKATSIDMPVNCMLKLLASKFITLEMLFKTYPDGKGIVDILFAVEREY